MLEFIFEILGEFLIQVIGEFLIEVGLHSLAEPFRQQPNPWFATAGYLLFGAILGGLSLLVVAHNLVPEPWRVANLIATPLAVGALMAAVGRWRTRRDQPVFLIDKFLFGFLFALGFAAMRFVFAS